MTSKLRLTIPIVAVAAFVLTALTTVASDRTDSDPKAPKVVALLEQGDLLTRQGQFAEARQAYTLAAQLVRGRGQLPERELRRVANAYYFEGRYEDAAATLRRLAKEAARLGDVDGRALAIADAIWMSALSGDTSVEGSLRDELRDAASSPELSDDVRRRIGTDPTENLRVFAPHLVA